MYLSTDKCNCFIYIFALQKYKTTKSYLQECNEEKEGVGCPPELRVEESREKGENVIFGRAEEPSQARRNEVMVGSKMRQEREKTK